MVAVVAVDGDGAGAGAGDAFAATAAADVTNSVAPANADVAEKPVVNISPVAAIVAPATVVGVPLSRAMKSSAAIVPHSASVAAMAIDDVPFLRLAGPAVVPDVYSVDRDCCRRRSSVAPNGSMAHVHILYTSASAD